MNNFGVATACMHSDVRFRFKYYNFTSGQRKCSPDRKANNAGANNHAVESIRHDRSLSIGARHGPDRALTSQICAISGANLYLQRLPKRLIFVVFLPMCAASEKVVCDRTIVIGKFVAHQRHFAILSSTRTYQCKLISV